ACWNHRAAARAECLYPWSSLWLEAVRKILLQAVPESETRASARCRHPSRHDSIRARRLSSHFATWAPTLACPPGARRGERGSALRGEKCEDGRGRGGADGRVHGPTAGRLAGRRFQLLSHLAERGTMMDWQRVVDTAGT